MSHISHRVHSKAGCLRDEVTKEVFVSQSPIRMLSIPHGIRFEEHVARPQETRLSPFSVHNLLMRY